MISSLAESMGRNLERWRDGLAVRDGPLQTGRQGAPIEIIVADGSAGFPDRSPFDRILISAGVVHRGVVHRGIDAGGGVAQGKSGFFEEPLLSQLTDEGILVYPENYGDLHRTRKRSGTVTRDSWTGVSFVPLRGRNA
jgi:protein-L-isoaspartate O-methyltransferase